MSSNCGKLTSIDFDWGVDDYLFPDTVTPKRIAGNGVKGEGLVLPNEFWMGVDICSPSTDGPEPSKIELYAFTFAISCRSIKAIDLRMTFAMGGGGGIGLWQSQKCP